MADIHDSPSPRFAAADLSPQSEGGLRAPPGLSPSGKVWWWFHFLILVKLARLRFIGILAIIGLVILKWDTLTAHYERWTRPDAPEHSAGSDVEYFCPMHPTVVRDNPKEKCPICFMPLSKRKKGEERLEALPPGIASRLQLSPYRIVLAGIQTWQVAYLPLTKEITTVGYIEFNEREMKQVAARVKGRLDKLYVNETGQMVKAGDVLASLYSSDLLVTVQNLLDAKRSGNDDILRLSRGRLELWGISADQIEEILKTGKANTHLKIRTPIDGHIIKKYVKEGQYVEEGSPLYDVVDLSTVWIQAQVFEDDMAFLRAQHDRIKGGLTVTATTSAYPGKTFTGKRIFIYPHVDQETRSVVIRFELDNPGHKLRPGTTASVKLEVPAEQIALSAKGWKPRGGKDKSVGAHDKSPHRPGVVLAVPESSVIDTGELKIVYRESGPGEYEGVKVDLGPRLTGEDGNNFFPVLAGLKEGDKVVTAGSFLVDAETRLNPAAGSIYLGGGGSKGSQGPGVRPSTPEDQDAKVKFALGRLPEGDRARAEAQRFCPVLKSNRLGSMGTPIKLMIQGQPVFLCCKGCEDKARSDPKATLAAVRDLIAMGKKAVASAAPKEEDPEVKAALAKLKPEERRLAQAQKFCPITGEPLGSMGVPTKVMLQAQPVFLCCTGCHEEAMANPAKTLAKVKELRAKQGAAPK